MTNIKNILFWRIAAVFLLLLVLLGIGYFFITGYYANRYFNETNQRLNKDLAQYTVDHVQTFKEGIVDTTAIQDIMHSMMVINPSVEVYLLDTAGQIITYVAPYKKVKLKQVDLAPIKNFLAQKEFECVMGDDPREPGGKKVFSAAPVHENDVLKGYYYIILAGEKQGTVHSSLVGSYVLKAGTQAFFVSLLAALLIALLALWFLTRNLSEIINTVRRFKEGDYHARINSKGKGELTELANTYNDMANTISDNIEQLKAVENLRRELTANVSHDLRTPLAIIQGYIETLLMKNDTLDDINRKKYLNIILSSSQKMGKLVKQLFEYSKLEANQVQPEKEPFFIAELAQDVFQKYQILAAEKAVAFTLDIPENLPLVFADVALVERVFQNLIDNALKFTPKGGTVTLAIQPKNNQVEVSISDTGPGIPEQEQSYIFERYHRIKTGEIKAQSNGSGAGLGLAIVKKILDIHNSTIDVISKPTEGTSFLFELPVYQQ